MARGDWFRALQVPVLPVSAGAAVVGSLLGRAATGNLNLVVFAVVLASLVIIQIAANLQKGIVESGDLKQPPGRPRSAFVFDAGAVSRTGMSGLTARRVTLALFAAGAGLGIVVVVLTRDPLLLLLGALGAFLAYSYSGWPLKLSYRGAGEVATFVAFGPLMVWGAFRSQMGGTFVLELSGDRVAFMTWETFLVGLTYGALAAMISFSRYFPAEVEDRAKGKRTPVVAFGGRKAAWVYGAFVVVAAGGLLAALVQRTPDWCYLPQTMPPPPREAAQLIAAALVTLVIGLLGIAALRSGVAARVERTVALTVLLQLLVTFVLVFGLMATPGCPG